MDNYEKESLLLEAVQLFREKADYYQRESENTRSEKYAAMCQRRVQFFLEKAEQAQVWQGGIRC